MKSMKFRDVPIGTKLRFDTSTVIYTRVNHLDEKGRSIYGDLESYNQRTLTHEENGKTYDAYTSLDSETMVEIIEEST